MYAVFQCFRQLWGVSNVWLVSSDSLPTTLHFNNLLKTAFPPPLLHVINSSPILNLLPHHPPPLSPRAPPPGPRWKNSSHSGSKGRRGKLAFRFPSSMVLYTQTPGPSTWQCDNVAGLFKIDPVFVKCFDPEEQLRGRARGPKRCLWKKRANFDHKMQQRWTFWLTGAGWAVFCCSGFWRAVIENLIHQANILLLSVVHLIGNSNSILFSIVCDG